MPFQRERNAVASPSRTAAVGSVRFAIKLAWDGTCYQGFQSQSHGNTIQDQVEDRLKKLLRGRSLRIFGWGRTDRGVHARGAVVTVDLTREEVTRLATMRKENGEDHEWNDLAAKSLQSALREFPCDGGVGSISAVSAMQVAWDFDPRFSSLWKRYVYFISCGSKLRSPFVGRYAWQMDCHLDVDKMQAAAELLSGRHNFSWLSVTQEGEQREPIRELSLTIERLETGECVSSFDGTNTMIKISGTCDFFLYKMMRRLVGALVAIGSERVEVKELKACIEAFDGTSFVNDQTPSISIPPALKETAPAHGLCLDHIEYEEAS